MGRTVTEDKRIQLKMDVQTLFNSLPEEERVAVLGHKVGRPPGKMKAGMASAPGVAVIDLSGMKPTMHVEPKDLVDGDEAEGISVKVCSVIVRLAFRSEVAPEH